MKFSLNTDFCRTPGYKMGRCISIYNCNYLLDVLRTKPLTRQSITFLQLSQCDPGWPVFNNIPYVCCARNDDSLILEPIAPAVQPSAIPQQIKAREKSADFGNEFDDDENLDDSIDSRNSSGLLPNGSECGREYIENRIYSGQVSVHKCY